MKTKQLDNVTEHTIGRWGATIENDPMTVATKTTVREGSVSHLSQEAKVAAASSLLLGARLRDWVTDQESAFLDFLAPENHRVFLIQKGHFLHPTDTLLFSLEVIEPLSALDGEAIFSHRYEQPSDIGHKSFRVRTTTIKPEQDNPLILGLYGPEDIELRDKIDDSFFNIVSLFRKASELAQKTGRVLNNKMDAGLPQLLVNRASGCVVHANSEVGVMLETSSRNLIGKEFGYTTDKIGALSTKYKIALENFTAGDMNLSLVTLTPGKRDSLSKTQTETFPVSDQFRSSLATIVTAASVIESSIDSLSVEETREMANVILDEAYDVNRQLTIEDQLEKYAQSIQRRVNLQYEVEKAIDRITSANHFAGDIKLHVTAELPYVTAPCDVYTHLFESILAVHSRATENKGQTLISVSSGDDDGKLVVDITTRYSGVVRKSILHSGLRQNIARLASKLGVELQFENDDQPEKIITSFAISPEEALA